MTTMWRSLAIVILIGAACGPQATHGRRVSASFHCKDRQAAYTARNTIGFVAQGVRLTCTGDVPTVTSFSILNEGEPEKTNTGTISVDDWDKAWSAVEAAGWRSLQGCGSGKPDAKEPSYEFVIGNDMLDPLTFTCSGRELPFPYDALRNGLDEAAATVPTPGMPTE